MPNYILVTGNPADGFIYVGPFQGGRTWALGGYDEATKYAEGVAEAKGRRAIRRADWWVVRLESPENKEGWNACQSTSTSND